MGDEDKARLLEDEEVDFVSDGGADGTDSDYDAGPKTSVLAFLRRHLIFIVVFIALLTTVVAVSVPLILLDTSNSMNNLSHLVVIGDSYSSESDQRLRSASPANPFAHTSGRM